MYTKTINKPLLLVLFYDGGGTMFLEVGFKGEATLPLSMKEFFICMCQISPKVTNSSL